jgi:hypothetical protein
MSEEVNRFSEVAGESLGLVGLNGRIMVKEGPVTTWLVSNKTGDWDEVWLGKGEMCWMCGLVSLVAGVSLTKAVEKVVMLVFNAAEKGGDMPSVKLRPEGDMSSCLELEAGWLVLIW